MPSKSRNDAIALALMFHLEHHSLVRFVSARHRFGNDSIEPRAFEPAEPISSNGTVLSRRRYMDGGRRRREYGLQFISARGQRLGAKIAILEAQQIEEDHRRGGLLGKHLDSRRSRMKPQLQRIKVETILTHNDDLAIENAAIRQGLRERLQKLGEIAIKRFFVAALDQDFISVAEDECPKAIPLGFEYPVVTCWQLANPLSQHRQDGWIHSKVHVDTSRLSLVQTHKQKKAAHRMMHCR